MLPDIANAIRLQIIDDRAGVLTKEIAALPKHIAEIEKKLEGQRKRVDADRAAMTASQKERKRLEGEIQVQEQKISKLKNQMMEAKTNEQYNAFKHEIEYCQKEISRFEDGILEIMGQSESLEKNVKEAEAALALEKKQVEGEKKEAQDRTTADQTEIAALMEERAKIAAVMTPKVLSEYERIRKGRAGVAIAEAIDGRCSKCHITLRPQFLQELKRGDTIMVCESCKRMLYINDAMSFDDLVPQSVRV